jgi:hypothetical protein
VNFASKNVEEPNTFRYCAFQIASGESWLTVCCCVDSLPGKPVRPVWL